MSYYVGLDVSHKKTAISVVDDSGGEVWRGKADTQPEMIIKAIGRWVDDLDLIGLETGSLTPWLTRSLRTAGMPVVIMDARRASDALKGRPLKTDRTDAHALAEMLQAGWYTEVFLKSEESHRNKALLSARDQLVRNKRTFFGQIRGIMTASSSVERTVERGRLGPVGRSATEARFFHLATVLGLIP